MAQIEQTEKIINQINNLDDDSFHEFENKFANLIKEKQRIIFNNNFPNYKLVEISKSRGIKESLFYYKFSTFDETETYEFEIKKLSYSKYSVIFCINGELNYESVKITKKKFLLNGRINFNYFMEPIDNPNVQIDVQTLDYIINFLFQID